MLRQRDDPSDAIGAAALAPEEADPAGSRNGGWRGASRWGWQGMAESRPTQLVVLGNVFRCGKSARRDLCGGRWVTGGPTAMAELMSLHDHFNSISLDTIREIVSLGREEDLHLDFKTVGDPSLTADDRRSLAVALSGFANSDGGIVVWGVDARTNVQGVDCAVGTKEIPNAPLCLSRLNELTGQCVSPLVDGVMHRSIISVGTAGFCLSLVPASQSGPHMAKAREDRYFKRSGSSFYRMEHFDLEDMFGRRPKAILSVAHRLLVGGVGSSSAGKEYGGAVILGLRNVGRGLARYAYLTLAVRSPYKVSEYGLDGNRNEGLPRLASLGGVVRYGASADTVIHPDVTHDVTRVKVEIFVDREGAVGAVADLHIDYEIAADGVGLKGGQISISSAELAAAILPRT